MARQSQTSRTKATLSSGCASARPVSERATSVYLRPRPPKDVSPSVAFFLPPDRASMACAWTMLCSVTGGGGAIVPGGLCGDCVRTRTVSQELARTSPRIVRPGCVAVRRLAATWRCWRASQMEAGSRRVRREAPVLGLRGAVPSGGTRADNSEW